RASSPLGGEVLRRSRRGGGQTGWWCQSPPRSAGRAFDAAEGEGLRPGGGPRSPRFPVSSPLGGEVLRRSRRGGAQTGWWPSITTIPSLLPARRGGPSAQPKGRGSDRVVALDHDDVAAGVHPVHVEADRDRAQVLLREAQRLARRDREAVDRRGRDHDR